MQRIFWLTLFAMIICWGPFSSEKKVYSQEKEDPLSPARVIKSIEKGRQYLISQQNRDGSFTVENNSHVIGSTSIAILALINSGTPVEHPSITNGLKFLRNLREPEPTNTYDISLMIMALTAANQKKVDALRVTQLTQKLEAGQITFGADKGSWGYTAADKTGDRSISQYAVLGLREAAYFHVPIDKKIWENTRDYFRRTQNADGGWGYRGERGGDSTGSMTASGVGSLSICDQFLYEDKELNPDGSPICCKEKNSDEAIERGSKWLARNFSVRSNPNANMWWLYYMYGLERAGRLSGKRFFGDHDWYRDGVRILTEQQSDGTGGWRGAGFYEKDPNLATSFSLLFLSKGLAPVLINKVKYGPRNPNQKDQVIGDIWKRHQNDARNLVEHLSSLEGWPKLITWQELDLSLAADSQSVESLLQAPILYLAGDQNISDYVDEQELELLREYVVQGGLIFAVNNCKSQEFDKGIRHLVRRMYPDRDTAVKPLEPTHAVFRSWNLLDPQTLKLEGAEVGCRTAIIYSPEDLSCLWDKWLVFDPPSRQAATKTMITRAMRIAVNVIAYATGGTLLNKLEQADLAAKTKPGKNVINEGYLSIAKIKHNGDWDAAPSAVAKLLSALRQNVGSSTTSKTIHIPATDPTLFRYGLIYMHGQQRFRMAPKEIEQLKKYLDNGGVLFADACCGAEQFDASFREMIKQLYPEQKLEEIPVEHEIFSEKTGYNIKTLKRRTNEVVKGQQPIKTVAKDLPPFLEGVKIKNRYAIIYSKYDISCALERQTSIDCLGYTPEDAVKLAVNVVLYSMLQETN